MTKKNKIKKDLLELAKDLRELLNIKSLNLNYVLVFLLIVAAFLLGFLTNQLVSTKKTENTPQAQAPVQNNTAQQGVSQPDLAKIQSEVIKKGYVFKIKWGDLGRRMVEDGVLDEAKFTKAVTGKEELPQELKKYLVDGQNQIELNQQNSQFWVDMLWGLGLANKNEILEQDPMTEGGNTANFASTGGYTIGVSTPMEIYNKYSYIELSSSQKQEVKEIAENVYRPCCGNSTAFPDCNHGMAMLGLIELMVSQGFSKEEIYKTALAFNSYWFPETYLNVAYHFDKAGRDYSTISPKELLSKTFSSAMGYAVIAKEAEGVQWPALQGGGSCGA